MAARKSKSQVPVRFRTGVWYHLFGFFYPVSIYTEKTSTVQVKRGRKVVDTYEETVEVDPFGVIEDPRYGTASIYGVTGRLLDEDGNHDASLLGETFLVIDGTVIPFVMEAGLTGTEGKLNKDGNPRKRNPKFSIDLPVVFAGNPSTFSLGVSQSTATSVTVWGGLRPVKAKKERVPNPESLISFADLAGDQS